MASRIMSLVDWSEISRWDIIQEAIFTGGIFIGFGLWAMLLPPVHPVERALTVLVSCVLFYFLTLELFSWMLICESALADAFEEQEE